MSGAEKEQEAKETDGEKGLPVGRNFSRPFRIIQNPITSI
jgi:hypothetical protein